MYAVRVGRQEFAMDRERSPRRSSKDHVAQSQMSWMNQERPTVMQPSHLESEPCVDAAVRRSVGSVTSTPLRRLIFPTPPPYCPSELAHAKSRLDATVVHA